MSDKYAENLDKPSSLCFQKAASHKIRQYCFILSYLLPTLSTNLFLMLEFFLLKD